MLLLFIDFEQVNISWVTFTKFSPFYQLLLKFWKNFVKNIYIYTCKASNHNGNELCCWYHFQSIPLVRAFFWKYVLYMPSFVWNITKNDKWWSPNCVTASHDASWGFLRGKEPILNFYSNFVRYHVSLPYQIFLIVF